MGKLEKGTHKIYDGKRGGKRNEGHYKEVLLYKHCVLGLYTGRLASDRLVMNPVVNPICSNVSVTPKKMQQTSNLHEIKLKCK